jgi:D-3-phosphoglycerate dehydrogenase
VLEKAPKLRVIGRAGVGVDNVDLDAATEAGVLVMNTPGGNAVSVAEHTLALMLAMARHIPQASASTRAGKWEKKKLMGNELRGKTLGIIGLGSIGREVVKRARAFEMRIVAHDPYVTSKLAQDLGVELVDCRRSTPPATTSRCTWPPRPRPRACSRARPSPDEGRRAHRQLRARRTGG